MERGSAFSGKARPKFQKLQQMVASGEVTEVMVIDQIRLSRDNEDLAFGYLCAENGVTIRCLTGGTIDLSEATGSISAGVQSVMNRAYQ